MTWRWEVAVAGIAVWKVMMIALPLCPTTNYYSSEEEGLDG